jgi:hypothetical protein
MSEYGKVITDKQKASYISEVIKTRFDISSPLLSLPHIDKKKKRSYYISLAKWPSDLMSVGN